jgi:hypothetical protein
MLLNAATLLLPAPDAAWQIWKPRATAAGRVVERPDEVGHGAKPLVIGLPATACRTVGMVLPNADHELMEQMIMTHLERKGLKLVGGEARNFRWHLLTQTAATATVSVDVLADPFPEDLALTQASDYTSALRLANLPHGQMVITEEHGSLVLALGYQGKLYHSHLFAPATAGAEDIAMEVVLARLALENDLGAGSISGVSLVGASWDATVTTSVEMLCGLPVRAVGQLSPNGELDHQNWTRLLPATVRAAQDSASRRRKLIRYGVFAGIVAVALLVGAFLYLAQLEMRAAQLTSDVAKTAPEAEQIKRTAQRWKMLGPAIEPKQYPLVLLSEITKLMPPSGIVIREFTVKGNEIDIRGDARDAQMAFQFVEDLQKHSVLGRYQWTKPQPTVREKTASFRAQGKAQ